MIVRIAGEGQFRIPDADAGRLSELDNEAVAAADRKDEQGFNALWAQILDLVEKGGEPVPDDELVESDVILPPRDVTFEEASAEFTGEGLIPD